MKQIFVVLVALLLCSVSAVTAQDKMKSNSIDQTIINNEKMAWKNLVDKKFDDFGKMLSDDYQGVYSMGTTNKASELTTLKTMTFKSADVSESKIQWVDKNTAIVTSMVKVEMVMPDTKAMSRNIRTTSIVTKRGKDWLCVYHTDTDAEAMK